MLREVALQLFIRVLAGAPLVTPMRMEQNFQTHHGLFEGDIANSAAITQIAANAEERVQIYSESLEADMLIPLQFRPAWQRVAPVLVGQSRRGFKTMLPMSVWKSQTWAQAATVQNSFIPSVFLGRNMGPFSGGQRLLNRYATTHRDTLPTDQSLLIEKDDHSYAALFNTDTKTADAVYYVVDPANFKRGAGRGDGFKASEDLRNAAEFVDSFEAPHAVNSYQGVGSVGIDRGHQTPVGSFNADADAATSTNQAENLTPQNSKLNRGNWKKMEQAERYLAANHFNEMHVLTGPLYKLPQEASMASATNWKNLLLLWCRSSIIYCMAFGEHFEKPSDHFDINQMSLLFNGKQQAGIRIPLGYFKILAIPQENAIAGFVMDQTGKWWPMAALPGSNELKGMPDPLNLHDSLKLPSAIFDYNDEKSAALYLQLAEYLK